jgi:fucose 4-O-acetylase-like acetyltransferase
MVKTLYEIDESLSRRIAVTRFPLMTLVVFVHGYESTMSAIAAERPELVVPQYIDVPMILLTKIVIRALVPVFFVISGLLLYSRDTPFLELLRKKTKSLLVPFLIWNLLLAALYLGGHAVSDRVFRSVSFAGYGWLDWVETIFGWGGGHSPYPLAYQFWFIRDLFVLSLLSRPIKLMIDRFPLAFLLAATLLWLSDLPQVFLSYEAILFFSLGCYVVKYRLRIERLDAVPWVPLAALLAATLAAEYLAGSLFPGVHKLNLLLSAILALKLTLPVSSRPALYKALSYLSGLSLFLFALHEPTLGIARVAWFRYLPIEGNFFLLEFIALPAIVVGLVLLIGIALRKVLPRFYSVLVGGR